MTEPTDTPAALRVIKKYPNRRLYDTETSTYVTLAQIRDLVIQARPLQVRDARTGEDLTRSILLQIILEEEAAGVPMFSEAMLANLIRFYGHAMQSHMGRFLEQQLQGFADWQARMGEQARSMSPDALQGMMQAQAQLMQSLWPGLNTGAPPGLAQAQEQIAQQLRTFWGLKT
ncbi:MAG: polyhydroxyalkanoate synthesis repressor PhaR [Limnohabitans sp.]|jgi:polyhydroxyalkanoate synthesis repressor PhaR